VRDNSPIKAVADLKGKTLSINGFSGSGHLWVQSALEKYGLKESDVTIVPLPFPAQFEALKSGKIDVGMFPQPFLAMAEKEGGVRTLFTAKTGAPYEEELMLLIAKDEWLKANAAVTRALLADTKKATDFYLKNGRAAKQVLIDNKMVRLDIATYDAMKDYYRDPNLTVDLQALNMMQEGQVKAGFQKNRADLTKYVDTSYLPK
jgi:ABC-type nitrate/sulfonate/bicarbonate transport system substrate-binding protein